MSLNNEGNRRRSLNTIVKCIYPLPGDNTNRSRAQLLNIYYPSFFEPEPTVEYFNYLNSKYNNERTLMGSLLTEAYNNHGVCLTYYVVDYDLGYDSIWGENLDNHIIRKFNFQGMYQLPREDKLFTKFGVQGIDQFSIFVAKMHFNYISSVGNLAYIPKVGDIVMSNFNKYLYEIVEVKEEARMYLYSKEYVWELIVIPFIDKHIALSASTSATMSYIKDYTNKSSDVFNIKSFIDNNKSNYLFQ